jgi:hypothetical protein
MPLSLKSSAPSSRRSRLKAGPGHRCFPTPNTTSFRISALYPETLPLSDDLQAELDRLQAEYDAPSGSGDDENVDEDAIYEKLGELEERIDEIEQSAPEAWTAEQYAVAGAIITLGRDGMPEIHRGMVRPEDERAAKKADLAASGSAFAKAKPAFVASLMQDLTAHGGDQRHAGEQSACGAGGNHSYACRQGLLRPSRHDLPWHYCQAGGTAQINDDG